jgi:hypothetical protein
MAIITRNILYRNPVDFTSQLPIERMPPFNPSGATANSAVLYHILSFLPARDLKTVRLVNRLLSDIGRKNIFWSDLCREKWSEKLCLQTMPMPSPHVPEPPSDDEWDGPARLDEAMEIDTSLEAHLLSMKNFEKHTYDELKAYTLYDLAYYFPAFHCVEGSWLQAYNLVNHHFEISYLCARVREDHYTVSDTQWELYYSSF